MIQNFSDLKIYLKKDREALGKKTKIPSLFGDEIWKIEIRLRVTEYVANISNRSILLKVLSSYLKSRLKKKLAKRCCEIPINVIGPGLCIWHGFGIIINSNVKIGSNFGVSAFCNIGHAHNKVPTIGDNVTMSLGSQVLGDVHICDNVVIGAKSLVLKDIDTEYSTWGGVPAKLISVYNPENMIRG